MVLVDERDGRQRENLPFFAFEYFAHQVLLVEPLHHDDDDTVLLAVEPTQERVEVPVARIFAASFGERVLRLHHVIQDDHIGTASSQDSTH